MIFNELQRRLTAYQLVPIDEHNVDDAFGVMKSNTYYHSRIQDHDVTREECVDNITTLPPSHTDLSKKTFVGVYKQNQCIALIDVIEGYPTETTAYLGLLIVDPEVHNQGIGKTVVNAIVEASIEKGFERIELACYESNEKGIAFWSKMGFEEIRRAERETDGKIYMLICMERKLASM